MLKISYLHSILANKIKCQFFPSLYFTATWRKGSLREYSKNNFLEKETESKELCLLSLLN